MHRTCSLIIDKRFPRIARPTLIRDLRTRTSRSQLRRRGRAGDAAVTLLREPRTDQYGIRCVLQISGSPIKFEIVFEGRVQFADPTPDDRICGVWALALQDKVATKLMANSDRWADASVMSRDVIDLAMLAEVDGGLGPTGMAKAVRACGPSVQVDLQKAASQLLDNARRLGDCMKKLGVLLPEAESKRRLQGLCAV